MNKILTPWIAQGRVLAAEEKASDKGHKFVHLNLLTVSGPEDYFLNARDKKPADGHVIRAVAMEQRPEPGQFFSDNAGLIAPKIFNIADLGDVPIDSDKRSHYDFGEVLRGEIVKNLGDNFSLDWQWAFDRLRLDDGTELNISMSRDHRRVGSYIEGKVQGSVFSENALEMNAPHDLFSFRFGNLGGMTHLGDVVTIVRPSAPKPTMPQPVAVTRPKSFLARVFG